MLFLLNILQRHKKFRELRMIFVVRNIFYEEKFKVVELFMTYEIF